ncbi:MAG: Cytochrome c heme lyase subunit CcmF [Anaerolineae bacterium]|jgi:cytochrome c-type biogenesis protein CcmF|nr:MAG: Cytochrome c heme lyase subunit CcmF [Anaerolineae bacterium]
MITDLGYGTLALTFLLALYGILAALWGIQKRRPDWIDSARNAMLLTFPLLTVACLSLIYLLVNGHYEVEYVASVTSNSMPLYLRITALWGGQAGSLLFWSWLMSAFASAVTLRNWARDREFLPWVIVVSLVTLGFFLGLTLFVENPFDRLWLLGSGIAVKSFFPPAGAIPYYQSDGNGLNPLLRHPGMIIHPPMLYLGFVSYVIPFAFAIAALITGRTDDRWIRITRRWSLVAWLFLSLGLILGGRWAYDVLGWGGYWGWDPVEIAAFMPWLTGTAFLHSVMIQEKRGMLKHWNMILIILTYNLVIFGTFLTRSGVLSSVHAFAQSAIGPLFFVYIGASFVISLSLLLRRWQELKSDLHMTSLLSREALFLLNNLLFVGILVVCFWGVIFPLISEIVTGQKVTVGPPFYERATAPLFAGLLFLMGIAPLAAWRHSTVQTLGKAVWKPTVVSLLAPLVAFTMDVRNWAALLGFWLAAFVACVTLYEYGRAVIARSRSRGESLLRAFWNLAGRNRRRYGGYIIHLGVVLMAIGIIGIELFQKETQGTLAQGEELSLGPYTMRFDSLAVFDTADGRNVARAVVSVYKNGRYVGELYPRRDYYYESQQPMTIPGLRSTMEDDFYVLLVDWQPISSSGATFKVYHNPLVNWLWLGGFVFIIGTMVAAWPESETNPATVRARRRTPLAAKAS